MRTKFLSLVHEFLYPFTTPCRMLGCELHHLTIFWWSLNEMERINVRQELAMLLNSLATNPPPADYKLNSVPNVQFAIGRILGVALLVGLPQCVRALKPHIEEWLPCGTEGVYGGSEQDVIILQAALRVFNNQP
ncbi:MAG: hypothetical protein WCW27_01270 [Patescibacteria group bacterium]